MRIAVTTSVSRKDRTKATTGTEPYLEAIRCVLPGAELEVLHEGLDLRDVEQRLGVCSALLLTGGIDIHPERYREVPTKTQLEDVHPGRDALESWALHVADDRSWPVLAICRGMQMLAVHRGGKLCQDIESGAHVFDEKHERWQAIHDVEITDSRLLKELGQRTRVNSRHHQAVSSLPDNGALRVVGRSAPDGVIEALEGTSHDRFVLGVQWHPESMVGAPIGSDEYKNGLEVFKAFSRALKTVS